MHQDVILFWFGSADLHALPSPEVIGLTQRSFAYLPFMHHEHRATQEESMRLYTQLAEAASGTPAAANFEKNLLFAGKHRDIVARFGRFPGRNLALGRTETPDEAAWVGAGGESFGQR